MKYTKKHLNKWKKRYEEPLPPVRQKLTEYNRENHCRQTTVMLGSGLTMNEVARAFGVSTSILKKWRDEHPEYDMAVQRGMDFKRTQRVENSLFRRAVGMKVVEIERGTGAKPKYDGNGKPITTEKVKIKQLAPDVNAGIFWLCNRAPDRWKSLAKLGSAEESPKNVTNNTINLTNLDNKELVQLKNILELAAKAKLPAPDAQDDFLDITPEDRGRLVLDDLTFDIEEFA